MEWGQVTGSFGRFLIVASGPSVQTVDLPLIEEAAARGVHIIAINGSIKWLPVAHDWFTLDAGPVNRPLMRNPVEGVRYFAAVPNDYGQPYAIHHCHRGEAEPGITYLKRITTPPVPGISLSENPKKIRSGNSAFGGLGLAYLMAGVGAKVALIGVDANRYGYAFGARGRPGRMHHMPRLFSTATQQLQQKRMRVVNGSKYSRVEAFKRMAANRAIEWVME